MNKRVVVAMSGGVDSSVSAFLLKTKGYEAIGVTIQTWPSTECRDERSKGCCSLRDIDDARAVARRIGIPYYVVDLSSDFKSRVMDYFVEEYLAGRTPNPCIECNRHIKFGILLHKAQELEADFVATGHYAQLGFDSIQNRYFISEGVDASKDQSYVLFGLTQEQLARTLLPVGPLHKTEVRALAQELGLRVFDKPDSQEICFVKTAYTAFLGEAAPERLPGPGNFVNQKGEVLGTHEGIHLYTVGQRKRIPLQKTMPYYVTGIEPSKNQVQVGLENDLCCDRMTAHKTNWLLNPRLGEIEVKIRSKHPKTPAEIVAIEGDRVWIHFKTPQKAVAPGQAAVFYEGPRVLGGGWIEKAV